MKKFLRLLKSEDFKKVLDQRHVAGKNDSFSIFYAKNQLNHARIGISVSNKIGNAVVRARIRRQLRAMINLADIFNRSYDIVIIARSGFQSKSFADNSIALKEFFQHLPPERDKA